MVVIFLGGCANDEIFDSENENITGVAEEERIIENFTGQDLVRADDYTLANGDSTYFDENLIKVSVFPKYVVFNVGGNVLPAINEGGSYEYDGLNFKITDIFEKKVSDSLVADNVEFVLIYTSKEFGKLKKEDKLEEGSKKIYPFPDREVNLEVKIISSKGGESFVAFYVDKKLTKALFDGDNAYPFEGLKLSVVNVENNGEPIITSFVNFTISSS